MTDEATLVEIDGRLIGLAGLDELFEEYSRRELSDRERLKRELFARVSEKNYVPSGKREAYEDGILRAFDAYLERKREGKRVERRRMTWRGIPREHIQWYPTVDEDSCDGCMKCLDFCSFGVFTYSRETETVRVVNPYACVVGCSLCGSVCRRGAISFPPLSYLDGLMAVSG